MKISKKIIAISLSIAAIVSMTSCNKKIIDTNYTFDTAIIQRYDGEQVVKIKSWKDYDGEQLQLTLEDDSVILVSSYNTILVSAKNGESEILNY